MEWMVTTAASVDEAKEAALDELGVDAEDAEFEVLEEPRQGLFGRLRGEARVRARVRPTAPRPKLERRDRRRRKSGATEGGEEEAPSGQSETGPTAAPGREPTAAVPRPVFEDEGSGEPGGPAPMDVDIAIREGSSRGDEGRGRAPRRRGPGPGRSGTPASSEEPDGRDSGGRSAIAGQTNGGITVAQNELSLAEQAQIAEQFVAGLLDRFGTPAQTSVETVDDDTVEIQVSGSDLGLLIGPKGQTLQAVQELTRTAVQRRSVDRVGRIHVDIAGYRVRRRDALERFTRQVAEDVVASGVQRALEPMSAADRKVVHDTANGLAGVGSVSEGEDLQRRVVLIPDASPAGDVGAGPPPNEAG